MQFHQYSVVFHKDISSRPSTNFLIYFVSTTPPKLNILFILKLQVILIVQPRLSTLQIPSLTDLASQWVFIVGSINGGVCATLHFSPLNLHVLLSLYRI